MNIFESLTNNQRKWATLHSSRLGMDIFCKVLWKKTDSKQTNMYVDCIQLLDFILVWSIIPDSFLVFYDLSTKWTLKCKFAVATSHVAHMWAELKHSWPQISLQLWLLPTDYPSPLHPPFTHHITLHVLHCYAELPFRFTVHASVVTFVSNTRQQLFFEEIFFNSREESVSSVKDNSFL